MGTCSKQPNRTARPSNGPGIRERGVRVWYGVLPLLRLRTAVRLRSRQPRHLSFR